MPRVAYVEKTFSATHADVIKNAVWLCRSYASQGYDLTLRQLYYQFIARDLFPESYADPATGTKNTERNYKRLGSIVNDARLAGLIDWSYIVDRTREPDGPGTERDPHWDDLVQIIDAVARSYKIDKWADQDYYVEGWVEKEALAGVLDQACSALDVKFFCCRGYSSQSAMWLAAKRIGKQVAEGKKARIIYLGDHDPSGIDMTRDVWDRLAMFIAIDHYGEYPQPLSELPLWTSHYRDAVGDDLRVDRVALNRDQVDRYDPPPNPAKLSDSRANGYVQAHGYESWELDALEPSVLVELISEAVLAYRDDDSFEAMEKREASEREVLEAVRDRWDEVEEFLS